MVWSISTRMPAELVIKALEMAMERRGCSREVIHYSDQGSQYMSQLFKDRCDTLKVQLSMESVGDYYDNAMAENFFATQNVSYLI